MKVLKFSTGTENTNLVKENQANWLTVNHNDLQAEFENVKAVLEISKIMNGTSYTAETVWGIINDESSLLHKKT